MVADVSVIMRENKIISITLRFGKKDKNGKFPYKISFHDSLQKLPVSLSSLQESFGLEIKKGRFPFAFVDSINTNLNFIGPVPAMSFYPAATFKDLEDYNKFIAANYPDNIFNLREEAIKYCLLDCQLLLKIMNQFTFLMFEGLSVDISTTSTLPGISFKLFRKKYFNKAKNLIPKFKLKDFLNLSKAFLGGATDLYIPTNLDLSSIKSNAALTLEEVNSLTIIEKLYLYDFNSLFPYILMALAMPCGKVKEFIGNIRLSEPEAVGFFYVNVEAPLDLKNPILQVKQLIDGKLMTISPVGKFSGWFFSKELDNAIKLGYKITILKGYKFDKNEILFKDFIEVLYDMRLRFKKGEAMNLVAKLLMNSLYGRFAMNPVFPKVQIMSQAEFEEFMTKSNEAEKVQSFQVFDNGHVAVTFLPDTDKMLNNNIPMRADVSIGISAATTAYSRILMSLFKNKDGIKIYYSDTDSIVTNLPPDKLLELFPGIIGPEIGQLKLEQEIEKAVFLSPKCYLLENNKGEKIIKIKGLAQNKLLDSFKNELTLHSFVNLLFKDSNLLLKQEIWAKDRLTSSINIIEQCYDLKTNENKRELIYNDFGIVVDTRPYVLYEVPNYIDPAIIKTSK